MAAVAMIVGLASAARAQSQDVIFEEPNLAFSSAGPVELESAPRLHMSPELGLRAGYFKPRDADDGEWFGGVQLRLPLAPSLALEGSIELHSSDFADGDIEVIQYPVQATLLVFLFPEAPVCPYLLGGLGWYYTRIEFSGFLEGLDDETDYFFGGHLGFGVRLGVGGSAALNADVRYIFAEPNEDALEDEEFDTLQFVLAVSFPF
jgi:hypothetical protein